MPAFCTHYLFFKDLEKEISENASFKLYPTTCAIGAQGPDIFFFHRALPIVMPGKPTRKVGNDIHKSKPEDIFDAFIEYLEISENKDIAKSYIYGFLLHYALDRVCHPYVYANARAMKNEHFSEGSAHNAIEMGLDAYYLHNKLGIDSPRDFDSAKTLMASDEERLELEKALAYMTKRVTGYELGDEGGYHAVDDSILSQKILRDKKGGATRLAVFLDKTVSPLIGYMKFSAMVRPKDWKNTEQYANIEKSEWHSPYEPDRARNESFDELFEYAKLDAKRLIEGFEATLEGKSNMKDVTNNISFLTGCEVK